MTESRDYLELAFRSIECFSNDGQLLPDELDRLLQVVLRDGVVDENERRILRKIIRRLTEHELTPAMLAEIAKVRAATGI
jgi:hypothetical protein